jgi:flagellar biosynthesis/type III secretory pathway protein FliH
VIEPPNVFLNDESAISAETKGSLAGRPRMIEFIIPLTLPLRKIANTRGTASPPFAILEEMARAKQAAAESSPRPERPGTPSSAEVNEASTEAMRSELDQELELLRTRRAVFINAAEELTRVTQQVQDLAAGLTMELQAAAVELAHVISSRLIFEEVNADRFPIANLVHEVISRLDLTASAVVRLHPADLAILQQQGAIEGSGDERQLQFVADSTLARGDCKAKAGEISVVYQLQRQIDDIRRQLLSTVNGHAET